MKKFKAILPVLIGLLIIIGSITTLSTRNVEANSEKPNCIYNMNYKMCFDYEQFNCTCVDVIGLDEND